MRERERGWGIRGGEREGQAIERVMCMRAAANFRDMWRNEERERERF